MLKTILLYVNTIRYLKFIQIFFRIYKKIPNFKYKYKIKIKIVTTNIKNISFLKNNKLLFVNSRTIKLNNKNIEFDKITWAGLGQTYLNKYKINYLNDLNSNFCKLSNEEIESLLLNWIDNNQLFRTVGWESYPTSIRIINIIKFSLSNFDLNDKILLNLYIQSRFLRNNCEWHLMGNHLLVNFKALIFAGIFFETKESLNWLKYGFSSYNKQIKHQILNDGGHFELSPMYQASIIEDILDIINLVEKSKYQKKYNTQYLRKTVNLMFLWLDNMTHNDGEISYFNDSVLYEYPNKNYLINYSKKIGIGINWNSYHYKDYKNFLPSGYFIYNRDNIKFIADIGNIKANYIPGHTHADTLSYELSIKGKKFITNLGISTYENNIIRLNQRGTASHNTVTINDENSSQIWSSFRVGQRSKIIKKTIATENNYISLTASHNGYSKILNKVIHERNWELGKNYIIITDSIMGKFKKAFSNIHIMPHWKMLELVSNKKFKFEINNSVEVIIEVICGKAMLEKKLFSHSFDLQEEIDVISIFFTENIISYKITWI